MRSVFDTTVLAALFVTYTSADCTTVSAKPELLPVLDSWVVVEIVTTLWSVPLVTVGVTWIVTVPVWFTASDPMLQVTVVTGGPFVLHVPIVLEALTKVTPDGSAST